jgi:Esterase-like activity of phytase
MKRPAGKKPVMGRRELLRCFAALGLGGAGIAACKSVGGSVSVPSATGRAAPIAAFSTRPLGEKIELHSWFDLPADDPRSRELSGIAWDETTHTLWGVQDETANIVPLVPDHDFKKWGFGKTITLKMNFPLDLEGIVVLQDGFIVASEKGPRILEVDRAGVLRKDVALPEHFAKARDNKSLESLTMSPDAQYLFTTSEEALSCDGERATQSLGTRLRILRISRATGEYEEHAYATDPMPHASGDYGVADLAAVSSDELLVLERGWTRGTGNTCRIYRVSLADPRTSCLASPALGADAPVLEKKLVIDLLRLSAKGLPPVKQRQESALLDNYEGMAIGPRLPDGRAAIVLISDDNGRTDQVARILVLAVG